MTAAPTRRRAMTRDDERRSDPAHFLVISVLLKPGWSSPSATPFALSSWGGRFFFWWGSETGRSTDRQMLHAVCRDRATLHTPIVVTPPVASLTGRALEEQREATRHGGNGAGERHTTWGTKRTTTNKRLRERTTTATMTKCADCVESNIGDCGNKKRRARRRFRRERRPRLREQHAGHVARGARHMVAVVAALGVLRGGGSSE